MQLMNFRLVDGNRAIETAGITVDLHDVAILRRQQYDVEARTLVLAFSGALHVDDDAYEATAVRHHDLVLTFEDVAFARIQYVPEPRDLTPSLVSFSRFDTYFGDSDEITGLVQRVDRDDWSETYYLGFVPGVDILVEAARVRADLTVEVRSARRDID